jgi:2-deoxy-D-gluconate 3-dehydrogenase
MSLEVFQLNGKNALVTGSHRGLGAAIAVALAKAGANVGCHGRGPNPGATCDEVRAAGRKTFYFSADLADSNSCSGLIEKTISEFGSIDILVNNAGMIRRAPATEYPAEFWNELIAVNLTAVFHLSQLAARHMIERDRGGKILNIASLLSFQGGILSRRMQRQRAVSPS